MNEDSIRAWVLVGARALPSSSIRQAAPLTRILNIHWLVGLKFNPKNPNPKRKKPNQNYINTLERMEN